jgi:hypothetical protein
LAETGPKRFTTFSPARFQESRERSFGCVEAGAPGDAEAFRVLYRSTGLKGEAIPVSAKFRQINESQPNVHHDAREFPDGQTVLLTQTVQRRDRAAVASACHRSQRANARFACRLTSTIASPASYEMPSSRLAGIFRSQER